MRLSRYKEALECCDEAIKLNIADYAVYNNKGLALESQGKLGKALEAFNKVLSSILTIKMPKTTSKSLNKTYYKKSLTHFWYICICYGNNYSHRNFIVLRKRKTTVQSIKSAHARTVLNYDELNQK